MTQERRKALEEVDAFVAAVFFATTEGREPMTEDEATVNLTNMMLDGIELPKAITPKRFAKGWNSMLKSCTGKRCCH